MVNATGLTVRSPGIIQCHYPLTKFHPNPTMSSRVATHFRKINVCHFRTVEFSRFSTMESMSS